MRPVAAALGQQRRALGHETALTLAKVAAMRCRGCSGPVAARAGVVITRKSPNHKYALLQPVTPERT